MTKQNDKKRVLKHPFYCHLTFKGLNKIEDYLSRLDNWADFCDENNDFDGVKVAKWFNDLTTSEKNKVFQHGYYYSFFQRSKK